MVSLFVDVSTIMRNDARTGIQRVVRAILATLAEEGAGCFELVPIYARKWHGYRRARLVPGKGTMVFVLDDRPLRPAVGDQMLALDFAAHLLPRHRRQLARWRRRGVSIAVVVYDLLPMVQPEWFTDRAVRHYRRWFDYVTRDTDRLCCISTDVARQLAAAIGRQTADKESKPRISVFPLGHDLEASFPDDGLPEGAEHQLSEIRGGRTLLMVGTLEPRKGHLPALRAFEALWRAEPDSDVRLVVAGRPGWKSEVLQAELRTHVEQGRRLVWLDDVSDQYLLHLYDACCGVIVPSYGEGFGLPVIEALGRGKPVLARDLAVFREINHPMISFFKADDPDELRQSILDFLADPPAEEASRSVISWAESAHILVRQIGLSMRVSVPGESSVAQVPDG